MQNTYENFVKTLKENYGLEAYEYGYDAEWFKLKMHTNDSIEDILEWLEVKYGMVSMKDLNTSMGVISKLQKEIDTSGPYANSNGDS